MNLEVINAKLEAGKNLPVPGIDARYAGNKAVLWAKCDRLVLGKDGKSVKVLRWGKFSHWLLPTQVAALGA
jgi:hypothetical protein